MWINWRCNMPTYFYITIVSAVVIFIMIREIYLFHQGKYYPYLNWNKADSLKKIMFDMGLYIVLCFSILNLPTDTKPPILFLLVLLALPLCINILNFLSYAKIRDRKIINRTIILDIGIFAYFLLIQFIIRFLIPYQ